MLLLLVVVFAAADASAPYLAADLREDGQAGRSQTMSKKRVYPEMSALGH
jgi:hypothetical protein